MSVPDDLARILEWTGWQREMLLPPLVGAVSPEHAFAWGRLRVLSAHAGRSVVGLSVVTAPSTFGQASSWRMRDGQSVPSSECLMWIALAVPPAHRHQGIGRLLLTTTLKLAVGTGYPYVVAVCPGLAGQGSLLANAGFQQVTINPAGSLPSSYLAYLRPTIHLAARDALVSGRQARGDEPA
jgi:GNAT superfamily N-acetyltransferase